MDPPEVQPEVPRREPYSFAKFVESKRNVDNWEPIVTSRMWRLLKFINDWAKRENIQLGEREGIPAEAHYFKAVEGDQSYILVVKPQIYEVQVEQYLEDPALIGHTSYAIRLGTMGYYFDPGATDAKFLGTMGYQFDPKAVESYEESAHSLSAFIGFSPPEVKYTRAEVAPNNFGWKVIRPGNKGIICSLGSGKTPAVDPFDKGEEILSLLYASRRIEKLDPDQEKRLPP